MMAKTTIERKIDDLAALIAEHPDDLEALIAFAEYQMRFGSRLEALQAYQHAIAVDKRSYEAYSGLAVIYMYQGLFRDGYSELLKVLREDSKNAGARLLYRYFSADHEPDAETAKEYGEIPDYKLTLRDIRILKVYYDSLEKLSDMAVSGYEESFLESGGDFMCEYNKEVAAKRKGELCRFSEFLSGLESGILDELLAEKRRLEEEERRRREEEERLRREEEERLRREEEERLRREEEERLRREEEERLRLEEEIRQAEEEIRRAEEEARRIEEEARKAEEERLRAEEEARREEEERLRAEEEARRAEEERLRAEAERKAEEERAKREKYESVRDASVDILRGVAKSKGVKRVILLERGGFEIASVASEEGDGPDYPVFSAEVMSLIDSHCLEGISPLVYTVLEYKGGLIAMRMLDSERMFVVVAGTGSSFGVLRYNMEKVRDSLLSLLS